MLLLESGADVQLINAEGSTPKQVSRTRDIRELIEGSVLIYFPSLKIHRELY